jgi:hypothetical protein
LEERAEEVYPLLGEVLLEVVLEELVEVGWPGQRKVVV